MVEGLGFLLRGYIPAAACEIAVISYLFYHLLPLRHFLRTTTTTTATGYHGRRAEGGLLERPGSSEATQNRARLTGCGI